MFKKTLLSVMLFFGLQGLLQAEFINFDVNQSGFTAPASGSGDAGAVIVDDQFASIGVLFRDMDFPNMGVWVGNPHGPLVSSPNVVYSNDGAGGLDYLVKVELRFVDPSDINTSAYVTSISGVVTDAGAGSTLTAYDINDNVLGVYTAVSGSMETMSLSGIGQIARVEFVAMDPTALDDINFSGLTAYAPAAAVSVPTVSEAGKILLALMAVAGAFLFMRRKNIRSF